MRCNSLGFYNFWRLPQCHMRNGKLLLLVCVAVFGALAVAIEPIPDHYVNVYPALFPKSGHEASITNDFQPGRLREQWYNTYEQYWKQNSYYVANPSNGRSLYGMFMKTKVEGYTHLPWPVGRVATNLPGLPDYLRHDPHFFTAFSDVGELAYQGPARGIGEPNWEVPPAAAGDVAGQLFVPRRAANPLLDGVWTPGESFYDANSNGVYYAGREGEDRWIASNKTPCSLRTNWPGIPGRL